MRQGRKNYREIAQAVGSLVQEKNEAYGDSFGQACRILEVLYPHGIEPAQYRDALAITRVIDKLFRLSNKKDAFGESPWQDIAGYALLGIANDAEELDRQDLRVSQCGQCDELEAVRVEFDVDSAKSAPDQG